MGGGGGDRAFLEAELVVERLSVCAAFFPFFLDDGVLVPGVASPFLAAIH